MPLRFLLASHPELLGPVLVVLHRLVTSYLIKKTGVKRTQAKTGAVSLIQRFGGSLNLNIHFHCLVLDGVYQQSEPGHTLEFHAIAQPTQEELTSLLQRLVTRLVKLLVRRGYLVAEQEEPYLLELSDDTALPHLQAASVHYRIAFGPNRGKRAFILQTQDPVTETKTSCVAYAGFSLHAGVSCSTVERQKLERLCRYITRPAVANERLGFNKQGNVICQLKTPYRDGTTHLIFTPLELLQRLSALIPRPRINLIRYHGILAPNARGREQVIPTNPANPNKTPTQEAQEKACYRQSWAKLLKRVFAIDLSHCPACGGSMKIVAAITDPGVILKILTHVGLSPQPPPRSPARYATGQDDLL